MLRWSLQIWRMFVTISRAKRNFMLELKYLKFSDFKKVCDSYNDESSDSHDLYQVVLGKYCADFIEHFRPRVLSGEFQIPDFLHHETNPGMEFAEMLEGKTPKYSRHYDVERDLAHAVLFTHSYYFNRKIERSSPLSYEQVYEALVTFTHTMSIAHVTKEMQELGCVFGDAIEAQCHECGERLRLQTQDRENPSNTYQFRLVTYDANAPRGGPYFVPAKPCECHGLKHWTDKVTFPSGKVYASDWFRILNFTKIIDNEEDKYKLSLNSRLGCFKISRLYAKLFNFAKFQVGNTCPAIFASDKQIVFGHEVEDDNGRTITKNNLSLKEKGYICTDLWAACFIDHDVLVDLLIQGNPELSRDEIESAVVKWAKKSGDHIVELEIEPGEYVMRYDGTSEEFGENFERSSEFHGIDVMGLIEKVSNNE